MACDTDLVSSRLSFICGALSVACLAIALWSLYLYNTQQQLINSYETWASLVYSHEVKIQAAMETNSYKAISSVPKVPKVPTRKE